MKEDSYNLVNELNMMIEVYTGKTDEFLFKLHQLNQKIGNLKSATNQRVVYAKSYQLVLIPCNNITTASEDTLKLVSDYQAYNNNTVVKILKLKTMFGKLTVQFEEIIFQCNTLQKWGDTRITNYIPPLNNMNNNIRTYIINVSKFHFEMRRFNNRVLQLKA